MDWTSASLHWNNNLSDTIIISNDGSNSDSGEDAHFETNLTKEEFLRKNLGPQHPLPLSIFIPLTVVYAIIFFTGVFGNLSVCLVIARNPALHTATSYYLFSLAVSDLTLLILGLPNDLFVYWQQYPWPFGEFFCRLRALISEMVSYTSVLTIVAFSMERYLAICHPLHSYAMSGLHRAVRIIAVLWIISFLCATPFAVFATVNYIDYPIHSGNRLPESAFCAMLDTNIPPNLPIYELSCFCFFLCPMVIIMILYIRIGLRIRERSRYSLGKRVSGTVHHSKSRRSIINMLLAVVATFFFCWAPFHLQRVLYIYGQNIPNYNIINEWLYYTTGLLYYCSSTANPILYNVMSVKYRKAFHQTLCGSNRRQTDLNSSFRDTVTNDSPKWTRTMTWKNSTKSPTTDLVVRITPSNSGRGKCFTTVRAATKNWPKTLLRVTMSPPDDHSDSTEVDPQTEIDVEAKLCCENSSSGGSVCIEMETCI